MTASQNGDTITGESARLAKEGDDEIDVIFAGHNHEVVNGEVNGKLIVQAFEYGKAIGEVNVTLDRKTKDIVKRVQRSSMWTRLVLKRIRKQRTF